MFFITIDIGISYLKVCLINNVGDEVLNINYKNKYLKDDFIYKELNVEHIYEKVIDAIKLIKSKKPKTFNQIISISVTSHGSTLIFIDRKGNNLSNAISVFDRRANKEAELLNSYIKTDENYKISGHRTHSELYAASKILWFKKNKRNISSRTKKILFLEDYIIFKLTGIFVTDTSMASISGLYNIQDNSWRKDILEILELETNNFSQVVEPGTIIGNINKNFAVKTGLNKNVTVVTGLLDALSNSLGAGNIGFNKSVECTGTVLSIITNTKKPEYNHLKIPINYFINNIYSLLPFSPTAGILLDWFGKNFYGPNNYYRKMEDDALKIKPKKDDIIFLPYLIDASIIHNNIKSSGLFFGINLKHKKEHFSRSIYESIGFILKENIMALEKIKNFKIESIISVGGASRSPLLSQIKSDISNRDIIVTRNSQVGCLGVAILSAVANNIYDNIGEACKVMIKTDKIYKPNKKYISVYEEKYLKFTEIFNNAKALF